MFHGEDGRLSSQFFHAPLFFFLFHSGENRADERGLFGAPLLLFLFKSDDRVANKCLFGPLLFVPFIPASLFLPVFHGGEGPVAKKYRFASLVSFPWFDSDRSLLGLCFPASLFLPLFHSGEGPVAEKYRIVPLVFLPWFESDRSRLDLCFPPSLFLPLFHGGEGPVAEEYPFGALVFLSWLESGDDPIAERYLFHAPLPFFGSYPTSAGRLALLRLRLLLATNFGKRHRPLGIAGRPWWAADGQRLCFAFGCARAG